MQIKLYLRNLIKLSLNLAIVFAGLANTCVKLRITQVLTRQLRQNQCIKSEIQCALWLRRPRKPQQILFKIRSVSRFRHQGSRFFISRPIFPLFRGTALWHRL